MNNQLNFAIFAHLWYLRCWLRLDSARFLLCIAIHRYQLYRLLQFNRASSCNFQYQAQCLGLAQSRFDFGFMPD